MSVFKQYTELPGKLLLAGAVITGLLITITYVRFQLIKNLLTFFAPVILIFPYMFLFESPVNKVLFPVKYDQPVYSKIESDIPVVMVVFDEFPVTSLMDVHHRIDSVLYPNFAALSRDSYWFRNATTVSDQTEFVLPAILSGNYPSDNFPRKNKVPTLNDYPNNLFTLLGDSYRFRVYETVTQLCPEQLCRRETFTVSFLYDIFLIYLHVLLPKDLTESLPAIDMSWKNFAADPLIFSKNTDSFIKKALRELEKDRAKIFRKFVKTINQSDTPSLYFIHSYLPHVPWKYLPSGKKYRLSKKEVLGLVNERWLDNELFTLEAFQRHLLQVNFVDTLLGELITKLKRVGLYDKSLVIITADHGVSFRLKESRRVVTKNNYQDILQVPLFIKIPYQNKGIISDRNVELVDILPSIADILDLIMPWTIDGQSVFANDKTKKSEKIIYQQGDQRRLVFDPVFNAKYLTLKQKLDIFGAGSDPLGLFKIGSFKEIVDKTIEEIGISGVTDVTVLLDNHSLYNDIELQSSFIPAHVTGIIYKDIKQSGIFNLAIALNGVIGSVTQTYIDEKEEVRFSAILPESFFKEGENKIETFIVTKKNNSIHLTTPESKIPSSYILVSEKLIISSDNRSIPIVPNALKGFLDVANLEGDHVSFHGWAADVKNSQLPQAIVLFVNRKFLFEGFVDIRRDGVAENYGKHLHESGFEYLLPSELFVNKTDVEVRVFAVSKKGQASELIYPNDYRWGKNIVYE
jgi:hypothetical protein